ncbi:MAG: response regulator transcription factor [Bradymonadaceae bacterium]
MTQESGHILVVDDDPSLLDMLAMSLEDEGFEVTTAEDGEEGLEEIETGEPDLVVCDINMPKVDGFTVCKELREQGNPIPLIMLTSRDNEVDEALGLELGADDYVAKPFNDRILVARIRTLLRRERLEAGDEGSSEEAETIEAGDLVLVPERLEVDYRGEGIEVTVTEFRLLETLARRPGVVFSRDQLLDRMRGDESIVADRLVDTYVRRLRRKFEEIDPEFEAIETVVGAGYRWESS